MTRIYLLTAFDPCFDLAPERDETTIREPMERQIVLAMQALDRPGRQPQTGRDLIKQDEIGRRSGRIAGHRKAHHRRWRH